MRRADRLFQIVRLLQDRRFLTGAELAEALEVSVRTVYRDIAALQASGVPIEGAPGVGYRLHRSFELPPLTLNVDEAEALLLGARMVQAWADPELAQAARSMLDKVEAVLPGTLAHSMRATPLFAPRIGPNAAVRGWAHPRASHVGLLRKAINERRKVRVLYRRADGDENERLVRPLGLFFWGKTWTLAAWCELRADYRNFRPDRMLEAHLTADRFDGEDGIHLEAFMQGVEEGPG